MTWDRRPACVQALRSLVPSLCVMIACVWYLCSGLWCLCPMIGIRYLAGLDTMGDMTYPLLGHKSIYRGVCIRRWLWIGWRNISHRSKFGAGALGIGRQCIRTPGGVCVPVEHRRGSFPRLIQVYNLFYLHKYNLKYIIKFIIIVMHQH